MQLFLAFSLVFTCLPHAMSGTNVIKNPSFEDGLAHWACRERPGLWNIDNASADLVSSTGERWTDGNKALLVKGTPPGWGARAVYAHQYVGGRLVWKASSTASAITFSWDYQLSIEAGREISEYYNPHMLLDIRYSDGTYMHVRRDMSKKTSTTFSTQCVTVPLYRAVDGLMVSVVSEGESAYTSLYVDDVTVKFTESTEQTDLDSCPLETWTFPVTRLQLPDYLTSRYSRSDGSPMAVTIATQLTVDRLPNLKRLVSQWQGPISAAVMLFRQGNGPSSADDRDAVADVVKFYQSSPLMQRYVDVHVVFEDPVNGEDSTLYPVNFLRNVAIKHVKTSHVYYLDVDIVPSLSCRELAEHLAASLTDLQMSDSVSDCRKCAFATPVFTSKTAVDSLPGKTAFVEEVKRGRDHSRFEMFGVVSHTPVNYHRWYTADKPYRIQYRENMEPYFVVPSDAPLLNDLFVGYGRDKCAYSRELNAAGYQFFVLHGVYAVNVAEASGQKSILRRFQGIPVRLRVFLNMYFHEQELERQYNPQENEIVDGDEEETADKVHVQQPSHILAPDKQNVTISDALETDSVQQKEENFELLPLYGMKCPFELKAGHKLPRPPDDGMLRQMHHEFAIIEGLAKEFDLQVMVQLESPSSVQGAILLALMHWDAIVSLKPGEYSESRQAMDNVMERRTGESLKELLTSTQRDHDRPTLYWLRYTDKIPGYGTIIDIAKALLELARQVDVVGLFQLPEDLHLVLYETVCSMGADWSLHVRNDAVVIRSGSPVAAHPANLPSIPDVILREEEPRCDSDSIATDIVLFTRDRPVQTLAFLESLAIMATGVNKVWLLYRADDSIFEEGYNKVVACMQNKGFAIELVRERDSSFGYYLKDILSHQSNARYVVIGVDEMVWLHPFNLTQASCLMARAGGSISTTQLRLGLELSSAGMSGRKLGLQTKSVRSTSEWLLYYPYRLAYDFGYVTNVDGVMIDREAFLAEFSSSLDSIRNPASLETRWVWSGLHQHVRQWHLMPFQSKLVNNPLEDGRILHLAVPGEKSYELARRFFEEDLKVDVKRFVSESSHHHRHTHEAFGVQYAKANCVLNGSLEG